MIYPYWEITSGFTELAHEASIWQGWRCMYGLCLSQTTPHILSGVWGGSKIRPQAEGFQGMDEWYTLLGMPLNNCQRWLMHQSSVWKGWEYIYWYWLGVYLVQHKPLHESNWLDGEATKLAYKPMGSRVWMDEMSMSGCQSKLVRAGQYIK